MHDAHPARPWSPMDSPSSQPSTPYLTFSTSSASPAHRRPILATSSSFGRQLDSPRRSATATRATSPKGGEIGKWSDLHRPQPTSSSSSVSSSEGSSPDRSKKETRMTGKTVHNASRPPPASLARGQAGRPSFPSLPPSGKKTSSLRWLEGFDRYLATIGGRDQVFKLVQYVLRLVIFLRRFRARGDASSTRGRTERVMDNISFARCVHLLFLTVDLEGPSGNRALRSPFCRPIRGNQSVLLRLHPSGPLAQALATPSIARVHHPDLFGCPGWLDG